MLCHLLPRVRLVDVVAQALRPCSEQGRVLRQPITPHMVGVSRKGRVIGAGMLSDHRRLTMAGRLGLDTGR